MHDLAGMGCNEMLSYGMQGWKWWLSDPGFAASIRLVRSLGRHLSVGSIAVGVVFELHKPRLFDQIVFLQGTCPTPVSQLLVFRGIQRILGQRRYMDDIPTQEFLVR